MNTYIHRGHTCFNKGMFNPIVNEPFFSKPIGGLWASRTNTKTGWIDWCIGEEFCLDKYNDNFFTFDLSPDARILTINHLYDLKSLPKLKIGSGNFMEQQYLDFEELAKMYDTIEVFVSEDYDLYYALYGWDCDSILIMNPDIIVV